MARVRGHTRTILGLLLHTTVFVSVDMTKSKTDLRQDGTCSSVLDCSLNGDCVDGKCKCDAGWSAVTCDVLSIEKQVLSMYNQLGVVITLQSVVRWCILFHF
jgi:hypothetical protein